MTRPTTTARHAAPYSPVVDHRLAHNNTGYEGKHAYRGRHALKYSIYGEEVADALWHIYSAPLMPWPEHRGVAA